MPRLKPETQALRRDHILDVAERCFALSGFHRATMHDICRGAGISPGALYAHFDSKEALIQGLCERDRAELANRLASLSAAPDLISAMQALGTHVFAEEPAHKRLFAAEMGVESTRNAKVAAIFRSVDVFVQQSLERLFADLTKSGRIKPGVEPAAVAGIIRIVGDGLLWRRAVDPDFKFESVRDALQTLIERLLNPQPAAQLSST